jgi:4-hydroxy-tetrahydrodipicolinate synthase
MSRTPRAPFVPRGTYTALVTPFRGADLAVDWDALAALVEDQVEGGVAGIVPCGTTGESPTLTHEEHDRVVAFVVERARGRVAVVAGTGSNSTREAERLTRRAAESGADAALVVCPYYNRPSQRMLLEHFRRVAAASPLPVVLYNIPGRTGVNLEADTVARLRREVPSVVAIKEASGSLEQVAKLRAATDVVVLSGDDALTLPMVELGAAGVVSVASNVVPRLVASSVCAALDGHAADARALHERLLTLYRALFVEPNPVPVKCALRILGKTTDLVRAPLLPALAETEGALRAALGPLVGSAPAPSAG